jgi:GntR family transcriptional regulator
MPAQELPGLLEQPLGGSLMDILTDQYGIAPARAVERIELVLASREEAGMLGVKAGAPLLSVERTAWARTGSPFEYSVDLFRGDRTRIITHTTGSAREVSHSEDGEAVEVHSS